MNDHTEKLWLRYAVARRTAWEAPSDANELRAQEYLAAFTRAFLTADEGEAA